MSITYSGIEWDYNNLDGIAYSSSTLLEPYATWFYLITGAINVEQEEALELVSDEGSHQPAKVGKESTITLRDYSHRNVKYYLEDSLTISEDFNRRSNRTNKDSITFSETPKRDVSKKSKDDIIYSLDECRYIKEEGGVITVVDQKELSGSVQLFDFEVNNSEWNRDDFNSWCENDCPVNYNEIRPFIPGEYEYTNAYVGFRLKIPDFSGQYGVANSKVYIDVEDTVEKGTSEAQAGSLTRVEFSKTFYTSPHIMTSLNYAVENCYIEVPTVTKEYFEFGLKSINSGNYLAGEINWLADGY